MFWSHLAAEIEAFQIHLVTTKYGDNTMGAGKADCWMLVLTMLRVICGDHRKVWVEAETAYGSDTLAVTVGQYIWGTPQAHRLMDYFLRNQFLQHQEVAPHINLYLFEKRVPWA